MNRVAAILLACALAVAGCGPEGLGEPNPDFHVIGHRGAPRLAAENTVPSFEVAVSIGANAVETDLCVTADEVIVVWHDRDPDDPVAVARQTGAEGLLYIPAVPPIGDPMRRPVDQLTLHDLRRHYGYAHLLEPRDNSYSIPTLAELFAWSRGAPGLRALYLDIKLAASQTDRAAFLVGEVAKEHAASPEPRPRILLLSPQLLIAIAMEGARRELGAEELRVAWDFEVPGALQGARAVGLRDVSMGLTPAQTFTAFTEEVSEIVQAREDGVIDSVTVWTFDRPKDLSLLLYHGVDGIMTNEPGVLYGVWQDTLQ